MSFLENPVFIKEIKTKMRARQSRGVKIAVACIVGAFVLWCYYEALGYMIRNPGTHAAKDCWVVSIVVQSILIWLLSPALAANAITQEKEQQTWEMMLFTLLRPAEILYGKLAARLVPVLALVAVFIPFQLICLASSDIPLGQFLLAYLLFAVWILFLGTSGLFMSWAFRKSAAAMTMSYLVLFALTIGTTLLNAVFSIADRTGWVESPIWWLNPIRSMMGVLEPKDDMMAVPAIVWSVVVFSALTLFLMWRMIRRFRAFAAD